MAETDMFAERLQKFFGECTADEQEVLVEVFAAWIEQADIEGDEVVGFNMAGAGQTASASPQLNRTQMYNMLQGIIQKYDATAKNVIQSLGR